MRIQSLLVAVALGAALAIPAPRAMAAGKGTSVDIQPDCGEHATYNEEYQVCFCDDGYKAGKDGKTCARDEKAPVKKEQPKAPPVTAPEPARESQDPPAAPAKTAPTKPIRASIPDATPISRITGKLDPETGGAIIFRGARVKVELLETLSSQDSAEGDQVLFRVIDPLVIEGNTVVAKDAVAYGKVVYARPAKGWGKSGQLDVNIENLVATDGTSVPLSAFISDQENWAPSAAGKTIVSALVAGPLGLAVGGGMKGKKVIIPKGSVCEVYVENDTKVKLVAAPAATIIKPASPSESTRTVIKEQPAAEPPAKKEEPVKEKPAKTEEPAKEKKAATDRPKTSVKVEKADEKGNKSDEKTTCFGICKDNQGDLFKNCMSNCDSCLKTCAGLVGEVYGLCLEKCSDPNY